jgi:hypothetical protein
MSSVVRLPRNEGGDDRDVLWSRHHGCKSALELRRALDDPDADLLLFPVGLAGYEMPSNVPFQVMAAHACKVCGSLTAIWAEWAAPQIWTP